MAKVYIENGIWTTLLHRLATTLHMQNKASELHIHDMEDEGASVKPPATKPKPDWDIMSPTGVIATIQLAVGIFTKVSLWTSLSADRLHLLSLIILDKNVDLSNSDASLTLLTLNPLHCIIFS